MNTRFFYGTLLHTPLLEVVLGRTGADLRAATLNDARANWVTGEAFPMIRLGVPNDIVNGAVIEGLSDNDCARLDFYEGGFGYDLCDVTCSDGTRAQVYVPGPTVAQAGALWDVQDWIPAWGQMSIFAAQEAMQYFGQVSAQEIAQRFPSIRRRADSRLRAMSKTDEKPAMDLLITWESYPYCDFFSVREYELQVQNFDGSLGAAMKRAVFFGSDASVVLPYDPVRDRVLLVEQARMAPMARGDSDIWQMEPVAGLIDPGETPEGAARREAYEEAGLTLTDLETVCGCYPSNGAFAEYLYIYVGLCDLPDGITGISGLASEGENIRSHLMSFDALMGMIDGNTARDGPLIISAYWLARHRDRLRARI